MSLQGPKGFLLVYLEANYQNTTLFYDWNMLSSFSQGKKKKKRDNNGIFINTNTVPEPMRIENQLDILVRH